MAAADQDARLDTKERILDAAERLFLERGVSATSLRAITTEADVNLASVHYHFGSKRGLLDALIARRVAPANQERLKRIEQLESAGAAPEVEAILAAFLAPVLDAEHLIDGRGTSALLFSEPLEIRGPLIIEVFGEVSRRCSTALARALPHLAPEEVLERFKFVVGVMVHVISGHFDVEIAPGGTTPRSSEERLQAIIAFLAAGLRAPAFPTTRVAKSREDV